MVVVGTDEGQEGGTEETDGDGCIGGGVGWKGWASQFQCRLVGRAAENRGNDIIAGAVADDTDSVIAGVMVIALDTGISGLGV